MTEVTKEALELAERDLPVDMILHCPACGLQHVDEPDKRTPGWTNPPHKSHLCHGCAHIWRPCDRPTNGVKAIATSGKADSPTADPASRIAELESDLSKARKLCREAADKLVREADYSKVRELVERLRASSTDMVKE